MNRNAKMDRDRLRAAGRILAGAAPPIGRPGYRDAGAAPPELREIPPPAGLQERLVNAENSYLRVYMLGECPVVVTREGGRWHLSISASHRLPAWSEVAEARYRLLPDNIVVAMILPPKQAYVNLHENCFHLYEVRDDNPEFRP